ncbi:MAG: CHAT domain-containing protein [Pirellulaceae bacterium]|nr:CHAT domain-containing protein [Pirellulaceae bacterium]
MLAGNLRGSLGLAVTALLLSLGTQPALAQRGPQNVPHDGYLLCFGSYFDGDFRTALGRFREAARDGFASSEGRWIDSICFHTMLGECYYQMGDLTSALDQYNSACKQFLADRDWMLRCEFPAGIGAEQNITTTISWGRSTRITTLGHYQDAYQSLQGNLDNQAVVQRGGVVAPAQLLPVRVSEIVRCTAVALSRRREIMGPLCEHDQLTLLMVDALSRRPAPPNNWSQCWVELELGMALAAANKIPQAASELQKSLLAGGQFEHPLTCLGLLELGKLAYEQGKYDAAITLFHEATISAAYFDRFEVMEEGFRLGSLAHLASAGKGVYPPLLPAAAWSREVPMLQTSLFTCLADNLITLGNLPAAAAAVADGTKALGRNEMALGAIGSRLNYQAARIALQSGNARAGGTALAAAMTYQKASSKRLFQIGLADAWFVSNSVTERVADLLFTDVLRESSRLDWITDPLDTLAVGTVPHPLPYEHWFELSLVRKEQEKALNIADRIRRHRFHSTQALGGRLLALRWVLEAPKDALSAEAVLQRQDLLLKYPKFAELSKRAAAVKGELDALPLVPADAAQQKKQAELLTDLAQTSAGQELLLQLIALERAPAEVAFPPLRETKDIQKQIPDGTLVFAYLATTRNVHGFALSKDRYGHFAVAQPTKVRADVAEMLKGMGHYDRTQPVSTDDLAPNAWRPAAERLLKALTNDTKPADWAKYSQLVVVPDGPLWYLPFEALPLASGAAPQPLLSTMEVRYAPTLGLAFPDGRIPRRLTRTAVVAGKLFPREVDSLSEAAATEISSIEDTTLLTSPLAGPAGILAATCDRLVLMTEVEDPEKLPFGWSPLQIDAGKPGSSLAEWSLLPFSGPEQFVFPGFHTPAEYGLKKGGTGEEVFLSVCGLMASGSRTILLSRWRVGGQSTIDLMREFAQELPHVPAATAWRRSVQLTSDRILDPAAEPRVKVGRAADGMKVDHPFFWSGYLLVDTGVSPTTADPPKPAAVAVP